MNHVVAKAIVLKRLNYGEADRILTVITPDNGKLSAIAKGARRAKSKLAGGLELFCVSDVGFINGKSELRTIVSARLDRQFTDIVKDVNATMLAYAFLKLIDEHTQDDCDAGYFRLLEHSLEALVQHEEPALTNVWFLSQLLSLGGRAINLQSQVDGHEFAEDARYAFDYDNMGFVAAKNGQYTPRHIKFLRLLTKVDTPANLLKVESADDLAKDLVRVLDQVARSG